MSTDGRIIIIINGARVKARLGLPKCHDKRRMQIPTDVGKLRDSSQALVGVYSNIEHPRLSQSRKKPKTNDITRALLKPAKTHEGFCRLGSGTGCRWWLFHLFSGFFDWVKLVSPLNVHLKPRLVVLV